jgi:hypothetical protein
MSKRKQQKYESDSDSDGPDSKKQMTPKGVYAALTETFSGKTDEEISQKPLGFLFLVIRTLVETASTSEKSALGALLGKSNGYKLVVFGPTSSHMIEFFQKNLGYKELKDLKEILKAPESKGKGKSKEQSKRQAVIEVLKCHLALTKSEWSKEKLYNTMTQNPSAKGGIIFESLSEGESKIKVTVVDENQLALSCANGEGADIPMDGQTIFLKDAVIFPIGGVIVATKDQCLVAN